MKTFFLGVYTQVVKLTLRSLNVTQSTSKQLIKNTFIFEVKKWNFCLVQTINPHTAGSFIAISTYSLYINKTVNTVWFNAPSYAQWSTMLSFHTWIYKELIVKIDHVTYIMSGKLCSKIQNTYSNVVIWDFSFLDLTRILQKVS